MIYNLLFPWQQELVSKIKDRTSYGLFLDMGLGKTPISLALAEIHECTKVLIITINSKATETVSTSGSWQQWSSKIGNGDYHIHSKKIDESISKTTKDVFVINYESISKRFDGDKTDKKEHKKAPPVILSDPISRFINECSNQNVCIIIDESHKIKNSSSKQSKAISMIKARMGIRCKNLYSYLLTGTPFTTGFEDLYNQLKFLGCPMNKTQFKDRFCVLGHMKGLLGWQQPIVGYKNTKELFNLVHQYAVTIKSSEVVDLPPQVFVNHISKKSDDFDLLTNEQLSGVYIDKFLEEPLYKSKSLSNNPFYRNRAYPSEQWLAETAGSFWMRARQISIGFQGNAEGYVWYDKSRLALIEKFLSDYPNNYVLFYNYTPELIELYSICEKLGYNIDVYCGEIKSMTFYDKYSSLNEDQKLSSTKNIIISNFASGSTGKNWQEYNQCILFSVPLYDDYAQGLKRINRTGQKNTTTYHMFYQDNWLDCGMMESLRKGTNYNEDLFKNGLKIANKK